MKAKKSKAERFVETAAEQFRGLIETLNAVNPEIEFDCSYAVAGFLGYAPSKYYRGCPFIELVTENWKILQFKALALGFELHYGEKCAEISTPELLVKIWYVPEFSFEEHEVNFFGKPLMLRFLSEDENIAFVRQTWGTIGAIDADKIEKCETVNCDSLSDREVESELVGRFFETMGVCADHNHSNGSASCGLCRIGEDVCLKKQ